MEKKLTHLEMIQAVITRMAGNSFARKGWAVTLVAGLFALYKIILGFYLPLAVVTAGIIIITVMI